jgi:lysine-specific demethylase 8
MNVLSRDIVAQLRRRDWEGINSTQAPFLLQGVCSSWPAVHRWNDHRYEYLQAKAGEHMVEVEVGSNYADKHLEKVPLPLKHFLAHLDLADSDDASYSTGENVYLAQYDVRDISELKDDYHSPLITRTGKGSMYRANIWIGGSRTESPCHYDPYNNILCQVFGRKSITLFRPESSAGLYPYTGDVTLKNTSQVDFNAPDLERFPLLKECYGLQAELHPGDGVFVPRRWWHRCKARSTNCSINFWWL